MQPFLSTHVQNTASLPFRRMFKHPEDHTTGVRLRLIPVPRRARVLAGLFMFPRSTNTAFISIFNKLSRERSSWWNTFRILWWERRPTVPESLNYPPR